MAVFKTLKWEAGKQSGISKWKEYMKYAVLEYFTTVFYLEQSLSIEAFHSNVICLTITFFVSDFFFEPGKHTTLPLIYCFFLMHMFLPIILIFFYLLYWKYYFSLLLYLVSWLFEEFLLYIMQSVKKLLNFSSIWIAVINYNWGTA